MSSVVELLRDLVAIPSVNPMGRVDPGKEFGESAMTGYLRDWFDRHKIDYECHEVSPGRVNILARCDPPQRAGTGQTLLFDAHQDTVPVEGMTIDPFQPHVHEGRLYGRGSCDVKGGMAAMLTAFAKVVQERLSSTSTLLMSCTVDEEYTHTGASYLAGLGRAIDFAVIAEPTRLQPVVAHKGAVRWRLTSQGISAHSSSPELGHNAIYDMARVLAALQEHGNALRDRPGDPMLGTPSLSVGRIWGGQAVNIVPQTCDIEIDRRIIPGETPLGVIAEAAEVLKRDCPDVIDMLQWHDPWVRMPALSPESSRKFWPQIREWVAPYVDGPVEIQGVPFGTNAGPLARAGYPCIVIGPGDIAQAHTRDEWIAVDQLEQAVDLYYQIASQFQIN